MVLLVVVAAPVLEELLFRGLLYGTLRRAVGPVPAAAVSALAFAAIHGLWIHAAVLFLLGYALARVYERTGSLWSAIALHATYNAAGLGLALLLRALLS